MSLAKRIAKAESGNRVVLVDEIEDSDTRVRSRIAKEAPKKYKYSDGVLRSRTEEGLIVYTRALEIERCKEVKKSKQDKINKTLKSTTRARRFRKNEIQDPEPRSPVPGGDLNSMQKSMRDLIKAWI